jgi:hypothetical protein
MNKKDIKELREEILLELTKRHTRIHPVLNEDINRVVSALKSHEKGVVTLVAPPRSGKTPITFGAAKMLSDEGHEVFEFSTGVGNPTAFQQWDESALTHLFLKEATKSSLQSRDGAVRHPTLQEVTKK